MNRGVNEMSKLEYHREKSKSKRMKQAKKKEATPQTSCTPGTAWMKTVVLVRWREGSRLTKLEKNREDAKDTKKTSGHG